MFIFRNKELAAKPLWLLTLETWTPPDPCCQVAIMYNESKPLTFLQPSVRRHAQNSNLKHVENTLKSFMTSSSIHGSRKKPSTYLCGHIIQHVAAVAAVALWVAVNGRALSIATSAATWGPPAATLRSPEINLLPRRVIRGKSSSYPY